jgi:hypothetical protein
MLYQCYVENNGHACLIADSKNYKINWYNPKSREETLLLKSYAVEAARYFNAFKSNGRGDQLGRQGGCRKKGIAKGVWKVGNQEKKGPIQFGNTFLSACII